jgi:hypothetical protein
MNNLRSRINMTIFRYSDSPNLITRGIDVEHVASFYKFNIGIRTARGAKEISVMPAIWCRVDETCWDFTMQGFI